jgi:hypothetical protein
MAGDEARHGECSRRFAAVRDGFARARDRCGSADMRFRFATYHIQLCVAGRALTHAMQAPFAHLRTDENDAAPHLEIELWDSSESGVAELPADHARAGGRTWDLSDSVLGDSVLAVSAGARFVSYAVRRSVAWLDRHDGRICGWFPDGNDLSLHQRGKPLQMLLAIWASDRGLHPMHAGLVGRAQRGVLLPGRTGSGKSTAALAALQDGYAYAGDDWIAVGRAGDGNAIGHGLYGTAALESRHAERFARLQPQRVNSTSGPERKSLLLLSQSAPERLAHSVPLCALALPRVVDRSDVRLRRASRREALLTMVPSSVFTMSPRGSRRDTERIFELAEQLPAYWLEIGRDLRQISQRIDDILQDVA